MSYSFRDYSDADWSTVIQLLEETMRFHISIQYPPRFQSYTKALLEEYWKRAIEKQIQEKAQLLVVEEDGKIIAFGSAEVDSQDPEMKKSAYPAGSIKEIYVQPHHRRKGVARTLLKKHEEFLQQHGCELIRVIDVHETNVSAKQFYERMGYAVRVCEMAKKIT